MTQCSLKKQLIRIVTILCASMMFVGGNTLVAFTALVPTMTVSDSRLGQIADYHYEILSPMSVVSPYTIVLDFGDIDHTCTIDDVDILHNQTQYTIDTNNSVFDVNANTFSVTLQENLAIGDVLAVSLGENATHQAIGQSCMRNPTSQGLATTIVSLQDSQSNVFAQGTVSQFFVDAITMTAQVGGEVQLQIQWAIPELRVGLPATNDDAQFSVYIHSSQEGDALYDQIPIKAFGIMPATLSLANDGTYTSNVILFQNIPPGIYDVILKTHQHLASKLDDVNLTGGIDIVNFSTHDNSPFKSDRVLYAGDVSNSSTDPMELGDNVVNSVDVSILLQDLDREDNDGNTLRPNVNQDTVVNSVDMSILLKNLDMTGDAS